MHIETDDLVQKLSENDEKFLVASITENLIGLILSEVHNLRI